jgi:hypothetical protein
MMPVTARLALMVTRSVLTPDWRAAPSAISRIRSRRSPAKEPTVRSWLRKVVRRMRRPGPTGDSACTCSRCSDASGSGGDRDRELTRRTRRQGSRDREQHPSDRRVAHRWWLDQHDGQLRPDHQGVGGLRQLAGVRHVDDGREQVVAQRCLCEHHARRGRRRDGAFRSPVRRAPRSAGHPIGAVDPSGSTGDRRFRRQGPTEDARCIRGASSPR